MKIQTAPEARATTKLASPKLRRPESQFDKLRELEEAIARRAYELFESRACAHGQDLADWLRAESEILQPLPIKVSEYQDQFTVEAEVPGFSAEEVEVSAEPRRLIISGRTTLTNKEEENTFSREIVANYTGILTKHIFRLLDLPVAIDADNVKAILTGGILNVTLPRLVVDQSSQAKASGSSRFLHGSVSEAVAIHAHCSVEVIHDRPHLSAGETAKQKYEFGSEPP